MKVTLNKDWGKHQKGDTIEIKDKTVIEKGLETKLFSKGKSEKTETEK